VKQNKLGVRLRWLSVSCYEIECGGTTIVTDPFITLCRANDLTWEVIEQCDILALTHAHWDHATDVPALMERFDPLLLCPAQSMVPISRWLNANPSRIYPMYPDVELNFGAVKVRPLYGRHVKLIYTYGDFRASHDHPVPSKTPSLPDLQPLSVLDYTAYFFTLKNGTRILYLGGNLTKEQIPLCTALKPDLAILQMSPTEWGISRRVDFAKALYEVNYPGVFSYETAPSATVSIEEAEQIYKQMIEIAKNIGIEQK
jgi:hypothetical protein